TSAARAVVCELTRVAPPRRDADLTCVAARRRATRRALGLTSARDLGRGDEPVHLPAFAQKPRFRPPHRHRFVGRPRLPEHRRVLELAPALEAIAARERIDLPASRERRAVLAVMAPVIERGAGAVTFALEARARRALATATAGQTTDRANCRRETS